MPAVSLSEAALALGFRSRSSLYRLKDAGDLAHYIRPPASPGGADRLELQPPGLPPLQEHVARLIRYQANNADRQRQARIDSRWGLVATALSEALSDAGGLQLCDEEAQLIAAALPAAMDQAFGDAGLERLRQALIAAGCWRAGNTPPPRPEGEREFWESFGLWQPEAQLTTEQFWENVHAIVGGMMGPPFSDLTGVNTAELYHQFQEAVDAVANGARWDQARWDAASTRSLLDDWDGSEDLSRAELEQVVARGLLPPDLQAEAEQAMARLTTMAS